jgi:hypothetical protein
MILDWLDQLHKSTRDAAWCDLFDLDGTYANGIDALNAPRWPIDLFVFSTLRKSPPTRRSTAKAMVVGGGSATSKHFASGWPLRQ